MPAMVAALRLPLCTRLACTLLHLFGCLPAVVGCWLSAPPIPLVAYTRTLQTPCLPPSKLPPSTPPPLPSQCMDLDPEYLPRRLLTDFSIYNAEVRWRPPSSSVHAFVLRKHAQYVFVKPL